MLLCPNFFLSVQQIELYIDQSSPTTIKEPQIVTLSAVISVTGTVTSNITFSVSPKITFPDIDEGIVLMISWCQHNIRMKITTYISQQFIS